MIVLGLLKVVAIIFSIFILAALIGFIKNIFNKNWEKNYCIGCKFYQTDECIGDGFNCFRKKSFYKK